MSWVSPYGSITDHEESHLQVIWAPSCVQGLSQSSNQKICHWKLEFLATRAWYCVDCAHVSISLALITGRGCDRLLVCAFRIYQPSGLFDASSYDLAYRIMNFVSLPICGFEQQQDDEHTTKWQSRCSHSSLFLDASADQKKDGIKRSKSLCYRCNMVRQWYNVGHSCSPCLHEQAQLRPAQWSSHKCERGVSAWQHSTEVVDLFSWSSVTKIYLLQEGIHIQLCGKGGRSSSQLHQGWNDNLRILCDQ